MQPAAETARAPGFERENNFDLIRLAAAMQVVVVHAIETFRLTLPAHDLTMRLLESFPGVPIFFGLSGFLISTSYFRSKSLADFARNRALRIFPALWLCFFLSVGLIVASGYFTAHPPPAGRFALWSFSQLTIGHFYNPEFMRGYGVGAINGSLWTIPVELQFYALTPLFGWLLLRRPRLFAAAVAVFAAINLINSAEIVPHLFGDKVRKLLALTFLPWFAMFLAGMLAAHRWDRIGHFFRDRFAAWLSVLLVVIAIGLFVPIGTTTNLILLPWALLLGGAMLAAGFTNPTLASRVLHRNDVSYGIYIYHMPIFNYLLVATAGGVLAAVTGTAATVAVALLSWRLVEKPALGLKRRTLLKRAEGQPEQRA